MEKALDSVNIVKLDHSNLRELMDFLNRNSGLKLEHFFPHPFNIDYLIYLLLNRTKDYYCMIMINQTVVAYGMLRGWEEGYDVPSLGVAVDSNYRGKGLGRLMCEYLKTVAELKGSKKIRLRVHKDNNKAKTLYLSLGYVFSDEPKDEYYEGFLEL